LGSLLPRVRGG